MEHQKGPYREESRKIMKSFDMENQEDFLKNLNCVHTTPERHSYSKSKHIVRKDLNRRTKIPKRTNYESCYKSSYEKINKENEQKRLLYSRLHKDHFVVHRRSIAK